MAKLALKTREGGIEKLIWTYAKGEGIKCTGCNRGKNGYKNIKKFLYIIYIDEFIYT